MFAARTILYSIQNNGRTGNSNGFIADIGGSAIKAKVSISAGLSRNLNGNKLITVCKRNGHCSCRCIGSIDTNMVIIVRLAGIVTTVDFNGYVCIKLKFLLCGGTCPAILGNQVCNCFACGYGFTDRDIGGVRSIGNIGSIGSVGSGLLGRSRGIIRRIATAFSIHRVEASEVVGIFQVGFFQTVHRRMAAIVTNVAVSTCNGSFQCVLGGVPNKYGSSRRRIGEVAVVIARNYIDVLLLSATILKIQIIATVSLFEIYVYSFCIVGIARTVIRAHHRTRKEIFRSGEESKLISFSNLGRGSIGGLYGLCFAANRANVVGIGVTLSRYKVSFVGGTATYGLAGVEGKASFCAGGSGYNTGIVVVMTAACVGTRGRLHICGNLFAEEKECKLGVVNKHVTCACDRLNRVVTTKLPSVNGVFFHPIKKNLNAFHNAIRTPSGV